MWSGCLGKINCGEMLGEYFLSLDSSAGGFVVTVTGPSKAYHTEAEPDAADAYARAALYVLGSRATEPWQLSTHQLIMETRQAA